MERQSQTRINLKEWTIISWVIWGERSWRPPAELNQGPPTPSLRQDKKEKQTSHRTAAPSVGLEQTKEQSSGRPGLVRSIWWARVRPALWVYKTKFPNCTLFPVRARNRQILRYFWLNPRPFGANSASRRDFRRGPRPSRTELVGMGETRVRMCATPPPPFYEHLYTPRVGRFLHWKRPPEITWLRAGTVSDDLGDSVSS